jgi:hypothetical protein
VVNIIIIPGAIAEIVSLRYWSTETALHSYLTRFYLVVGCWLSRHEHKGEGVLDRLNALSKACLDSSIKNLPRQRNKSSMSQIGQQVLELFELMLLGAFG